MELHREDHFSGPVITGFSGQGFKVREQLFPHGMLITPDGAHHWDAPVSVALLDPAMLMELLAGDLVPEFLLLGTGRGLIRPTSAFVQAFEARGLGVEAMDSRAAARAWGVLRQEGRQIVGALMPL